MVKAITFDCWDTLLDDDAIRTRKRKEHVLNIFKEHDSPVTRSEIDELFAKEGKIFQNYIIEQRKTPNARMRIETIAQLANVQIPATELDDVADYCDRIALDYRPPVVRGVREVLDELTKTRKLAVICNTGWHSGETVRQLLEGFDLPKYFLHLTFSDEAGIAKPHKQIFEHTLDKLGCNAEDAVHIGDSEYSDIVGAKEAKMKAILFTGINDKYKGNNTADITIGDYDNFVEIIKKMD